jgi:hypothetical protein
MCNAGTRRHERRYDLSMVRRMRILIAAAAAAAGILSGAALAPAAGDRHATGSSAQHVSYTEDGIPFVDSGIECKAGHTGAKRHRRHGKADPSDY